MATKPKKKIAVICPTHRDIRELAILQALRDFAVIWYGDDVSERLEGFSVFDFLSVARSRLSHEDLSGIISTDDYPGSILGSVLAREFNVSAPRPEVLIACQHKLECRHLGRRLVPEATPAFSLVDPISGDFVAGEAALSFPFFVKPVKSFFSIFASVVSNHDDMVRIVKHAGPTLKEFAAPLNQLAERYAPFATHAEYLLAEELMRGVQVTVEGYVWNGKATIMGVVDSVMFPGTISFRQFVYPSRLSERVQVEMSDIAARFMEGVGFDNGLFNIEMMYDECDGSVRIIEVNPRMSSQFADLFEKVDGVNSYEILLNIALGQEPMYARGKGKHTVAVSHVLRTFSDKKILRVPDKEHEDALLKRFPDMRIELFGKPGETLSALLQDGNSFRYGIINLGGESLEDVAWRIQECEKHLAFEFGPL